MDSNIEIALKEIAKCKGKISKAKVARLLGWSNSYFHQGFKEKVGVSFRAKRFQIKMEIAGSLLASSSMTVEQIANCLGYSERCNFHFHRAELCADRECQSDSFRPKFLPVLDR